MSYCLFVSPREQKPSFTTSFLHNCTIASLLLTFNFGHTWARQQIHVQDGLMQSQSFKTKETSLQALYEAGRDGQHDFEVRRTNETCKVLCAFKVLRNMCANVLWMHKIMCTRWCAVHAQHCVLFTYTRVSTVHTLKIAQRAKIDWDTLPFCGCTSQCIFS